MLEKGIVHIVKNNFHDVRKISVFVSSGWGKICLEVGYVPTAIALPITSGEQVEFESVIGSYNFRESLVYGINGKAIIPALTKAGIEPTNLNKAAPKTA